MPGTEHVDIFATKGIEYLFVIGFLIAFVFFARMLVRSGESASMARLADRLGKWFRVPEGIFFHQGHGWAAVDQGELVTVGIDDFAQRLLGRPSAIRAPRVGDVVRQGERGVELGFGERFIGLLSPVEGEVVAVNEAVIASPGLVNDDPYGNGWLFQVRVPRLGANLKSLLSGQLARSWMDQVQDTLQKRIAADTGIMQDGGLPVEGIARNISPAQWEEVAKEFLFTD